jgi:ribosomal-protein-alanine N-acetyltransferase
MGGWSESLLIRFMEHQDLGAVVELSSESGFSGWKMADYQQCIEDTNFIALVALRDNGSPASMKCVIGFLFVRLLGVEGEILLIAVEEEFRRRGVASKLLDRLFVEAGSAGIEKLFLEVRKSNIAAIGLYAGKGFFQIGRRLSYYSDPAEDALLMIRKLRKCG